MKHPTTRLPPPGHKWHANAAPPSVEWKRAAVVAVMSGFLGIAGHVRADTMNPWPVAGRQGIVQIVVVPAESTTHLAAYRTQIAKLCVPEQTCFINFYANSAGAAVELPLPASIAVEATARFRRSSKNGVEVFQWSCRLGLAAGECF